jgi:hypothetical protein
MTEECCKKNFFASLADTALRVVKDPTIVPNDVKDERLAICAECEHNKNGTCELCGCVLALKSTFGNMACPIEKWAEYKR